MFKQTVSAIAVVGFLGACAQDGSTNQSVVGGAALGAVAGAVIGAIAGDRKGALIGAGVGAVAGGAIGGYLDQQQKELEKNLEGTGATVTNTGEELLVNLPNSITFDVDRALIKPEFRTTLAKVADTLVEYESSIVDVIGHTDSTGSEAYNQELSQRRADNVAKFLSGRGVLEQRIASFGVGETQPVADNATEVGRAENRRVEIRIEPLTEES